MLDSGAYRSLALALLGAALAVGCGRTEGSFLGAVATPRIVHDAGEDGILVDAGVVVDAGAPTSLGDRLARAMSCDLDDTQALRAAARYVSCDPIASMPVVMDLWEAFTLGGMDPYAAAIVGIPPVCGLWQCAAEANSCEGIAACLRRTTLSVEACQDLEFGCAGDVLGRCIGGYMVPHLDCGALGARCEAGACVRDGCRFGNGETFTECADDQVSLELCGVYSVDCRGWLGEAATCARFYVSGEVPVPWCSTVGNTPGAYDRPVECSRRGEVTFQSVSGRTYTLDCRSLGYRGCDEGGCRN